MKVLLPVCLAAVTLLAACAPKQNSPEIEHVRAQLQKVLPDLKADAVRASDVPGMYEVQDGANFGYVTADGKYMIEGDLLNLKTGESVTENRRKADRIARLATLGENNMIVFAPEGHTKHVVTVFTDVDCGYCRRLHSQIAEYNAQGIEIRYVSYPRSGPDSESFRKAEAVWCSADRKTALTQAKLGVQIDAGAAGIAGEKCENVVHREWDLGNDFGLRGTPMLVLEDGSIVNGYLPPDTLEQRLDAPPGSALTGGMPRQG